MGSEVIGSDIIGIDIMRRDIMRSSMMRSDVIGSDIMRSDVMEEKPIPVTTVIFLLFQTVNGAHTVNCISKNVSNKLRHGTSF